MTPLEVLTLHALKAATLSVVAWQCRCGVSWDEYGGTHAQHQWEALEAALTVRTVADLDALPELTVVGFAVRLSPFDEPADLYAAQRDGAWFAAGSEEPFAPGDLDEALASGPARLLWRPEWGH